MPGEERLVDRDVLDADRRDVRHQVHHPVDQQKRVAMRNGVHDAGDVDQRNRAAGARARLAVSSCCRVVASIALSPYPSATRLQPPPRLVLASADRFVPSRTSRRMKAISRNMARTGCAGLPTTSAPAGTSDITPACAPIRALRPIRRCPRQPGLPADHDMVLKDRGPGNADLRDNQRSRARDARCARSAQGCRGESRRRSPCPAAIHDRSWCWRRPRRHPPG